MQSILQLGACCATNLSARNFLLQEHMSDKDCWLVIEGKVYDVTPFLDEHPGGFDTLVSNSGAFSSRPLKHLASAHSGTLWP